MKLRNIIISLALLTSLLYDATAAAEDLRQFRTDSLRGELAKATTVADSITILSSLFDLSRHSLRTEVGEELYRVSQRHIDQSVKLDIIRRLAEAYADSYSGADRVGQLTDYVASLPQSEEQRATLAFMRVQMIIADDNELSESDRQKRVHELIKTKGLTEKSDPYDHIELLFIICRYLQNDINGELLSKYLDELGQRLEMLPTKHIFLRNLYLVQASMVYTISGQNEKAVKVSRELLKAIAELEKQAKAEGLKYRNYDAFRYIAYRRLLNNYAALTDQELDEAYARIEELAERDIDIKYDFERHQRPDIYYMMAKKKYPQALAILKKQVDNPANKVYLSQLYPYMLEAALAVGDRDATLKAALGYNEILRAMVSERAKERTYELQMLEEMHNISGSNAALKERQRNQAERFHRTLLTLAVVASVILVIIIVALFIFNLKARRLSRKLASSNYELEVERDNLINTQAELIAARDHARRADRHKTEFINNMSHEVRTPLNALVECSHLIVDNVPEEKRRYLARYADMVDVSADMIRSIVSDVLQIAEMDNNSDITIDARQESVNNICRIAVESVRKYCRPGVTMNFLNTDDPDIMISTDAGRLEQILINLLKNGAKFTEEGYVNLSYSINPDNHTITFAVEDTGIGVPPGKEEIIFERFEKLSNLTSGTGLGLNISRMIARRLHGTVSVDTTYPGPGARFILTLPIAR